MDLTLPPDSKLAYSTAVISGDSLIILTSLWLSVYSLSSGQQLAAKQHERYNSWSNCVPIVYADCVLVVDRMPCESHIHWISLQTGSIISTTDL